jgi:hypothetical protein
MGISGLSYEDNKMLKAINNLRALNNLRESNDKERWSVYRQLPKSAMYLVASHYSRDNWNWAITSKWDLFAIFDKSLKPSERHNAPKIRDAMDKAIETQSKVVALRRLFSQLHGGPRDFSTTTKSQRYYDINVDLLDQLKHCIWAAHGMDPNAGIDFADRQIQTKPDSQIQFEVIEKAIRLLKDGYTDLRIHERSFLEISEKYKKVGS